MAKIVLLDDSFDLISGWFSRTNYKWRDVIKASSVKENKVTYEELHLVFKFINGKSISVGELDKGFGAFEAEARRRLSGFNTEWRSNAEDQPLGTYLVVWER